ncbi:MAG: methylenetetrahydrofolate reductase C-terminal domain-containing protein [Dehalococcoidia bacterium]|nr:methylenetetrahydrofolate reductase C-terminal domain-containing protein [Dehalococcoidia bacterium]
MIVGERKPFNEIRAMLEGYKKVLILGCGTCVSVCMAGGQKEVSLLASQLRMDARLRKTEMVLGENTIQRQCDREYIEPIVEQAGNYDVVLSMACGAGVQLLAEMLTPLPVVPALNTTFLAVADREGTWLERCRGCGNCILADTGGICPVARCAKSLFNGPCGGSKEGKCEVSLDIPCAWQLIYDRLSDLGQLSQMEIIQPIRDWRPSDSGAPRSIVREDAIGVSGEKA